MIYVLLRRKIRLSNYQYYFIANVAASDVFVSIAGVFRGLGIINSVFIGSPNQNTTINCALYTLFLNSFASSGSTALIPLTLDRAIAIVLPLHHRSIVNKTTGVSMIVAGWLSVATVLVYESVAYSKQAIKIEYLHGYHRWKTVLLLAVFFFLLLLSF